jgi:hypothetical protein
MSAPAFTEALIKARVQHSIARLNAGDPDDLLAGYAEDVVVITPLYPLAHAVGEPELRGKAAFRDYLLDQLALYARFSLVNLFLRERGFLLMLESETAETLAVSVEFNQEGLGQRVLMLHV